MHETWPRVIRPRSGSVGPFCYVIDVWHLPALPDRRLFRTLSCIKLGKYSSRWNVWCWHKKSRQSRAEAQPSISQRSRVRSLPPRAPTTCRARQLTPIANQSLSYAKSQSDRGTRFVWVMVFWRTRVLATVTCILFSKMPIDPFHGKREYKLVWFYVQANNFSWPVQLRIFWFSLYM